MKKLFSTRLSEKLIKDIKRQAVEDEIDLQDLVAKALEAYLERKVPNQVPSQVGATHR